MIKKFSIITITTILILYGTYYWGIPYFANKPQLKDFMEKEVSKQTGYKFKIDNPKIKMGISPSVWFWADDISVLNNDDTKAMELKDLAVKIKLLPFIFKKAEISYFKANDGEINFIFDKNAKLKFGQYPIMINSNPKVVLDKAVINLGKYKINLDDEMQNKKIVLQGEKFDLSDFQSNKRLALSTNSYLYVGQKASKIELDVDLKLPLNKINKDQFKINGNIKDLDLSDFNAYVKVLSKGKYKSISGIVNLTAVTTERNDGQENITSVLKIDNLNIEGKEKATSIWCDNPLKIVSSISTIKNGLDISDLEVKAKDIDILMRGTLSRLNSKMPLIDLKTIINNTRTEAIIPLLPGDENFSPDVNFYLLKKYFYYSLVNGQIDIKGKLSAPYLYGKVLSKDGYVVHPIKKAKEGATVKLDYKKNEVYFDVVVPSDISEKVLVKGKCPLYGEKIVDIDISSTKNIDLTTTQDVLNPLHGILKFDIGPVPIMKLKGMGNIQMHVQGSDINPHVWGNMNFYNTDVAFIDINNMLIKDADARLDFNNQKAVFKSLKANLNGKPVSVEGTATLLGDMDFKVVTNNQNSGDLIKIITTSEGFGELQDLVKFIKSVSGNCDLSLKLKGTNLKPDMKVEFNKDIFADGTVNLTSNKVILRDIPTKIDNLTGKINFNNMDGNFDLEGTIGKSALKTKGAIKNNILTATVTSDKFILADAYKIVTDKFNKASYIKDFETISTSFVSNYKGKSTGAIEPKGLTVKGKIYNNKNSKSSLIISNGSFELKDGKATISPITGSYLGNPYSLRADVGDIFSQKPKFSGEFTMNDFDLKTLNNLAPILEILPQYKNILTEYNDFSGKVNIASKVKNNNIRAFVKPDNAEFSYKPKNLPIKISNGHALLDNGILYISKINSFVGSMPVFITGKTTNIYKNPNYDIYVNAKPTQEFFDQFFNNKSVYPIKIKGDVLFTSKLAGTQNHLNIKSEVKISENSNIYYMGATVGEVNTPVQLNLDAIFGNKSINISQFKYDRLERSQNNKEFANNQLIANGNIDLLNNGNLKFHNFKIKTATPTDARIFNIIFKKPLMKQGLFNSDLTINGEAVSPRILGTLSLKGIDVPFLNLKISDSNFDFKKNQIFIKSKGSILTSNFSLDTVMKNKLYAPYIIEKAKLNLQNLDINKISESLQNYDADIYKQKILTTNSGLKDFDLSILRINQAEVFADNILVKALQAKNLKTSLNLDEKMNLNIPKFSFDMAEGSVQGNSKYNINSKDFKVFGQISDANAQIVTESLFGIKGQFYGTLNSELEFQCNGKNKDKCLQSMQGNGNFRVTDGKMPKLGSLEYLLKANNLIKEGIRGLSITGIIDLITPLKTGEFESINASYIISNGKTKEIKIFSKGDKLNIYVHGDYDLITSVADMQVLGSLTNNVNTIFGKVKNASLNTLLNTIPFLNKNEISPELEAQIKNIPNIDNEKNVFKIFVADIDGDIEGSKYVKSFKWVK